MAKKGLGKGIEALFTGIDTTTSGESVVELKISEVEPDRSQPRHDFDEVKLAELAGSIEDEKRDLIELLSNRSSTKAKIQKFDTMMEQIQVRRSELHQNDIPPQFHPSCPYILCKDLSPDLLSFYIST